MAAVKVQGEANKCASGALYSWFTRLGVGFWKFDWWYFVVSCSLVLYAGRDAASLVAPHFVFSPSNGSVAVNHGAAHDGVAWRC
eukprot:3757786-Pyramimonas_sp.AAC.1